MEDVEAQLAARAAQVAPVGPISQTLSLSALPVEPTSHAVPPTRPHPSLGALFSKAVTLGASDLEIEALEIMKMRARLNRVIADKTGQPLKKVEKDTERNFWMSAEEGVEYGLASRIITSPDELK